MSLDKMFQIILTQKSREALAASVRPSRQMFSNAHLGEDEHTHHVTLFHPRSHKDPAHFALLKPTSKFLIIPTGVVETSYVVAVTVVVKHCASGLFYQYQACGRKPLHITVACADGVQPVAANDAIASQRILPVAYEWLDGRLAWVDA